jgi:hypothetical protein
LRNTANSVSNPLVITPAPVVMPSSVTILTMMVKNSAPNNAPTNEPRPPLNPAPPSTQAAMLVRV